MSTRSLLSVLGSASACVAGPSRARCMRPSLLPAADRPLSTSAVALSGHNRWSKIRHRKGAADAERASRINKLLQGIFRVLRMPGSTDPNVNSKLADALAKAKEGGATKAHIESTIARAQAIAEGSGKEMVYEAIGPGGREALMIQCVSDNPNRTIQGINKALDRHKFRIAPVAFMFEKKGLIIVDPAKSAKSFDELFEVALEGGAEDVREAEGDDGPEWEVYVPLADVGSLTQLLSTPPHSEDFALSSSELVYMPNDPLEVTDDGMGITDETAETILSTAEILEEEGDVVKVWTNLA